MNIHTVGGQGSEACREQQACGDGAPGCENTAVPASPVERELVVTCHNCVNKLQVIEGKLLEAGCEVVLNHRALGEISNLCLSGTRLTRLRDCNHTV